MMLTVNGAESWEKTWVAVWLESARKNKAFVFVIFWWAKGGSRYCFYLGREEHRHFNMGECFHYWVFGFYGKYPDN